MESLPIAGYTTDLTSVSRRFPAAADSAFPVLLVSVALLLYVTFTPNNAGSQDSYHE